MPSTDNADGPPDSASDASTSRAQVFWAARQLRLSMRRSAAMIGEVTHKFRRRPSWDVIKTLHFGAFHMHGVIARRRVIRFGLRYLAGSAALMPASDFPLSLEPLRARVAAVAGVLARVLSESLMTEYEFGAGIGWHRDSPPFGIVAGISLGGGCRTRLRRGDADERQTWAIELPPRSLYVMSGQAREKWQHSIPPVKEPRWSIAFRTLRAPDADV